MAALTGNPDLDLITLSQLDDRSLEQACRVNKYAYQLCNDPRWQQHLSLEESRAKPQDIRWKDYYVIIRRGRYLANIFKLGPYQSFVRTVSERGVMKGSELYHDYKVVIPRAIAKGDMSMIDYFIEKFREKIATRVITMPDFNTLMSAAAKANRIDLVDTFLDIRDEFLAMGETLPEDRFPYTNFHLELGKKGYEDYFKQIIVPRLEQSRGRFSVAFIHGLILGGHHELALEYSKSPKWNSVNYAFQWPIIATHSEDIYADVVPLEEKDITPNAPYAAFLYNKDLEILVKYESTLTKQSMFSLLAECEPDLALDYFYEHEGEIYYYNETYREDQERFRTPPIIETCSEELFDLYEEEGYLNYVKPVPTCSYDVIERLYDRGQITSSHIVQAIVTHARYDLIPLVAENISEHPDFTEEAFPHGHLDVTFLPLYLDPNRTRLIMKAELDEAERYLIEEPLLNYFREALRGEELPPLDVFLRNAEQRKRK